MNLKPFFCYFGGQFRSAMKYPVPIYNRIIEPFVGSAGYSLRYFDRKIILIDKDPVICGIWDYLIKVKKKEIKKLPLLDNDDNINDFSIPQEAKWLIGFWLNKGVTHPCNVPSAWMRSGIRGGSFWGEIIRERIANQIKYIRHWKIINDDYFNIENYECTWFIDPPYISISRYRFSDIDYEKLSEWSINRNGQVMVCEKYGANWLPFKYLGEFKAMEGKHGKKRIKECLFYRDKLHPRPIMRHPR